MFFGISGLQVRRCVDFIGLVLPRKVGGGGKQKRKYLPKGEVSLSQSKVYGAYCPRVLGTAPGVLTRIPGVANLSYLPHLSSYPGRSGRGPMTILLKMSIIKISSLLPRFLSKRISLY